MPHSLSQEPLASLVSLTWNWHGDSNLAVVPWQNCSVVALARYTNVMPQVRQSYAAAAIAAGDSVKLVELAGVDHFALINPYSEAWTITVEALQELLR